MRLNTIRYENEKTILKYQKKTKYDLIILIIASPSPFYDDFTNLWKSYMERFPNAKIFFLYADDTIGSDVLIGEDRITYNCKESYIPGIFYKTIAGYFVCQKLFDYKYVLRTNLSSFIHIPRLLAYLERQPTREYVCCNLEHFPLIGKDENTHEIKETEKKWLKVSNDLQMFGKTKENWKKYTGVLDDFFQYINFVENNKYFHYFAGSFFVFTEDVVQKIVDKIRNEGILNKADIAQIPDDIAMSAIVQLKGIQPAHLVSMQSFSHACECIEKPIHYSDDLFHIRNRTDKIFGNREVDVQNMKEQIRTFYGMQIT